MKARPGSSRDHGAQQRNGGGHQTTDHGPRTGAHPGPRTTDRCSLRCILTAIAATLLLLTSCGGDPAADAARRWAREAAAGGTEQRAAAVAELARIQHADVVAPLLKIARTDVVPGNRIAAVRALGRPGLGVVPADLAPLLDADDQLLAVATSEALAALREPAATAVLADRLGRGGAAPVQIALVQALAVAPGGAARLAERFAAARTTADDAALAIAAVFGRSGDRARTPALVAALEASDVRLRRAAADALAQLGDDAAAAPLAAAARTASDNALRSALLSALARLPAGGDALIDLAADPAAAKAALAVLAGAPEPLRARVVAAVGDARRPAAVRIALLGALGPAAGTPAAGDRAALLAALAGTDAGDDDGEEANAPPRRAPLPPAVEPLIRAGLADPDPAFRLHCAERAARAGDAAAVAPLLELGAQADAALAGAAVAALGLVPDPRSNERLLAVLTDPTATALHGAAATALGQLGERRAAAPLLELALGSSGARTAAIAALGRVGDAAVGERLLPLRTQPGLDRVVLEACATLRTPGAVAPLIARLERLEDDEHTMRLLGRLGDARAVDAIIRRISDPLPGKMRYKRLVNHTVRAAGDALVAIGDPRAVPVFLRLVRTPPDEFCRPFAIAALGRLPHADGAAALVRLLTDAALPRPQLEALVAPAIVGAGARAVPALATLLAEAPAPADGADDPGMYAAQLLGAIGADAVPALTAVLDRAPARHVLGRLCEAYERIAAPAAVTALVRIAGHAEPAVRTWAVLALGRQRHADASAALAQIATTETDPEVRKWLPAR